MVNNSIYRIMNTENLFDDKGQQNGLINELIRLMTIEKIVITTSRDKKPARSWTLRIVDNDEFILGSFAKYVYNQVYKAFCGIDDRNDKENLVGNTLLLVFDSLSELVTDEKYQTIFTNLGLEQNIDGMKAILINEDYSKQLYGYLKKIVKIKIKGLIREGYSYNIDGKEFHKNGKYEFTDYTMASEIDGANDEGEDGLYPDGYVNSIADTDAHKFTEYEEKNYYSVLELVMDNKEDIFTNKQLEFMKDWGNKEKYSNEDKKQYKRSITKRLFEYCDNNPYIMKDKNGKYNIRKTTLDDILADAKKLHTNLAKFEFIMNELSLNQQLLDRFMDRIIEKYDNGYYKPIVLYLRNKKNIDLVFINTKFSKIINTITL